MTDNSVLKDSKKQVVLKRQEETALEALLLNVEKEKLKDIIDKIYDRGGKSDD